jgi:hypothetical protein
MPDITSANAVLTLAAIGVLSVPQQIQGFATDDIYTVAPVSPVETMMGIDGDLSAGFVYTEKKMDITLMAGSPSNAFFDALQAAQEAAVQPFELSGVLTLPSNGIQAQLVTGYLTRYPPLPNGKKVLQPRVYEITWQNINISPVSAAG